MQYPLRFLFLSLGFVMKNSRGGSITPTNTPRVFRVETTWNTRGVFVRIFL